MALVGILESRVLAARLCKSRQVGCVAILKYKQLAARLGQFRQVFVTPQPVGHDGNPGIQATRG